MNMSRELSSALMRLLERRQRTSLTEDVKTLIDKYTEKDLQEAVLVKDNFGRLPIHYACIHEVPLEVIQMYLDSNTDKKSILEKDINGWLPIHISCGKNAPVEVIQLLLDSDVDKKTIFEKDRDGQLPIHVACWILILYEPSAFLGSVQFVVLPRITKIISVNLSLINRVSSSHSTVLFRCGLFPPS